MKSCIYRGTVTHTRHRPHRHAFSYDLFMMYLDLAELDSVFDGRWLWSTRGPAPAWFRRADYLGPVDVSLDRAVRDEAERLTGGRPGGPVRVLTHLRYFGYVQNPVTFYYCFSADDGEVDTILAEITNTPWKERHTYALRRSEDGVGPTSRFHRFDKAFHVSPFMDMDHEYGWSFSEPGDRLTVHMDNRIEGSKLFDASLVLEREPITGPSLAAALARYPFMTARVATAIYWQAFRLWLKRTPFFPHPDKRTSRGAA